MYVIPRPTSRNYHTLCKVKTSSGYNKTIMTYINEEEEFEIDNLKKDTITLTRGDKVFTIRLYQIYCYGEVNFDDKNDLSKIDSFTFLNHLKGVGVPCVANYDYKTHCCISNNRDTKWSETFSPSWLAKYAHACLNKPKRIILFSYDERIIQKKRKR